MTTVEKIMQTSTFKNSSFTIQTILVSPSNIGVITNALEMKKAGYTYEEWLKNTCAGKTYKAIVKELFQQS